MERSPIHTLQVREDLTGVKKAEAKDYKLRFLERENARLRRLLLHANI